MPRYDVTLNLPGFTIKKTYGFNPIIHEVSYQRVARCPHCKGKNLRKKDEFTRYVMHETVGLRSVYLRLRVPKYHCRNCGRYFRQQFAGIMPWQRSTESAQRQVYTLHSQGISRKDLSTHLKCSDSTISSWHDHVYHLEDKKRSNMQCPEVLGIDEHFFSRKQGYATTLCDLKKHRIFDVTKGKSAKDLSSYLEGLTGKERVKVVCMDMSESYRSIVRKYFPNAKIVADRFHVIRLVLHRLVKTCQDIDPELKHQRGIVKLLRTHKQRLSEKQEAKLKDYLKLQPAVEAVYTFKEELVALLLHKTQTKKKCAQLIPKFLKAIQTLKETGFKQCKALARSLKAWEDEIVRMWRFSKSNGITEGFHRKMKLIQRRAFGFTNFENYRRRVRVVCM